MSRIRSVHPGLFTDERFVALSDAAQIFGIGLWTEADDQGVFEWKPLGLKMKLRAATTTPVEPLLAELASADCIRMFEVSGRKYGAIRNFGKFQRPKFPKWLHPITDDIRSYVGSTPPITVIELSDDPPIPRNEENPPLMEDGGGSKEAIASLEEAPATKRRRQPQRDFIEDEPIHPAFAKAALKFPQHDAEEQWALCRDWHLRRGQTTACMGATANTWLKGVGRFTNGQSGTYRAKPSRADKLDADLRSLAETLGFEPGRVDDIADPAGGIIIDGTEAGPSDRTAAA